MSIESVMPSNHLILCSPLLLLPSIFPSNRVFSNESALCIRWPKHWSFSFSISPSNKHPGLISFRMDWLDLLAVQGILRSLLQHHHSKAILRHSAFFIVQLSHPYMTPGKTIALTRRTFITLHYFVHIFYVIFYLYRYILVTKMLLFSGPQHFNLILIKVQKFNFGQIKYKVKGNSIFIQHFLTFLAKDSVEDSFSTDQKLFKCITCTVHFISNLTLPLI